MSIIRKNKEVIHTPKVLYWGLSNNLGGIETYLRNISKYSLQYGWQSDFLVCYPDVCYQDEILNNGSEIYTITQRSNNPIKFYIQLIKFFKAKKGEYVAVHFPLQSASLAEPIFIAKLFGHNVIVDSRSEYKGKGHITNFLIAINSKLLHLVDVRRIAITKKAGLSLFGKQKFDIIPSAINLDVYQPNDYIRQKYRAELNLNGCFVIGHIGRFSYEKNHIFLISVFEQVKKHSLNSVLVLIGDGYLKQEIKSEIEKRDLTASVRFLGLRDDIPDIAQVFDLFVFPSHFEGLGRSVIEMQALGIPIIASKNIPEDIEITPLVKRLDLNKGINFWVNEIVQSMISSENDEDYKSLIKKAGYSLEEHFMTLNKLYFEGTMPN